MGSNPIDGSIIATIAQLVEQSLRKREVGGSSPPGGSRYCNSAHKKNRPYKSQTTPIAEHPPKKTCTPPPLYDILPRNAQKKRLSGNKFLSILPFSFFIFFPYTHT